MFKSTLLHASDGAHTFKKGYKNRRINFTLLFGNSSAIPKEWGGVGVPPDEQDVAAGHVSAAAAGGRAKKAKKSKKRKARAEDASSDGGL